MKSITPSARMGQWTATAARAETHRLDDPGFRWRLAERAVGLSGVDSLRADLQAQINDAVAAGADAITVLRKPMNRRRLFRARTALDELRMAEAVLAL